MDKYDRRMSGESQGSSYKSKDYVGGKVKARVSKGQIREDANGFPSRSEEKHYSPQGFSKKVEYPDTMESIIEKQDMNKKNLDKSGYMGY